MFIQVVISEKKGSNKILLIKCILILFIKINITTVGWDYLPVVYLTWIGDTERLNIVVETDSNEIVGYISAACQTSNSGSKYKINIQIRRNKIG